VKIIFSRAPFWKQRTTEGFIDLRVATTLFFLAFAVLAGMGIECVWQPLGNRVNPVRTASRVQLSGGEIKMLRTKSLSTLEVNLTSVASPETTRTFLGIPTGWSQVFATVPATATIGLDLDHYRVLPVEGQAGTVDLELLAPQVTSVRTDFLYLVSNGGDPETLKGFGLFGAGNDAQLAYRAYAAGTLSAQQRVCTEESYYRAQAEGQAEEIWRNLLSNHGVKVRNVTFKEEGRPWVKVGDMYVPFDCAKGEELLKGLLREK
jgi:hypothetical protein